MEDYTTGTGQKIKVHDKDKCKGEFCCIHNPSDHIMKDWPTHWRDDRFLMERICECGIGHPDPDDLAFKKRNGYPDSDGIHGCDGCCSGTKFGEIKEVETFKKEEFDL
jgi:hypothetical protein